MSDLRKLLILILLIPLVLPGGIYCQYFYEYNGDYKYFLGNVEPDTNWRNVNFNDSNWITGFKNIGFGNKNDSTPIPKTTSVYLRIRFDITDRTAIKKLNLMVDFDDAFVAYLNDTEIVRVNIGKPGEYIYHDRLADRSHEAVRNRQIVYNPLGYFIDSTVISKCLRDGTNILSVQVHNDSLTGSDLAFISSLFNLTNSPYSLYNKEDWCIKKLLLDSSYFPIVVINTDEYGIPLPHVRYKAKMGIINNGMGRLNKTTDAFTDYSGRISIEIRGEISAGVPKKSYNIETQDTDGNDKSVVLLGMPKDNDWILYGPFLDKSLIRNEFVMSLGRKLGHYESRERYCEFIFNGEFLGLYILMENIKRDRNRVNITQLYPGDTSGIALTGGYIVKYDKPSAGIVQWVYPKDDVINSAQRKYITNYFKNYYALLDSPQFMDKTHGYKKYIDEQSLLDYVIVNEVIKNCDSYLYSTYFYKDRDDADGRLKFGPLWDNDLAFGNSIWQEGYLTTGWQFEYNPYLRITRLFRDTSLVNQLNNKWKTLRKGFLSNESMMYFIDSLTNYLYNARARNFTVWPIIDKNVWDTWGFHNINLSSSYEGDIANMKDWIEQRLAWIDENISKIYYPLPNIIQTFLATSDLYNAFPNPFSNKLKICFNIDEPGSIVVEIDDIYGRKIIMKNVRLAKGFIEMNINSDELSRLSKGIHILTISKNGNLVHKEKLLKF